MTIAFIKLKYANVYYTAEINFATGDAVIESYKNYDVILEKDEYRLVYVCNQAA